MQTIATEPLKATYNACSVTVLTLHLRFVVCSQNNWKIHFPATTHLRQLCSCLFSITSSVFHLPLKIPIFWKTVYYPNHASTAQLRKSCPATTDLEKCYDADKMLHAVTTNRRNEWALKFHLDYCDCLACISKEPWKPTPHNEIWIHSIKSWSLIWKDARGQIKTFLTERHAI